MSIARFASSDFTTRFNDVETICRRINPDDWDGDGIVNERDHEPMVYDGDFYGVANALPTNATPDAYYWLDLSVTGLLGVATIRVTCDGPSDLGDHVIIALTNQVCHVPLLAGATYAVDSNLPIDYSAVSTEHAGIVTNAENRLAVSLPLELTFELVQMHGGSDSHVAHTYPVDVSPQLLGVTGACCSCSANGGGFSWHCSEECSCSGYAHELICTLAWAGYSRCFMATESCSCQRQKQDDPALWFALSVPNVVFVNATNHPSVLCIEFDPPTPTNGVLTLSCIQGDSRVRLRHATGSQVELPRQWNAEMFAGESFLARLSTFACENSFFRFWNLQKPQQIR